jgi:hypothetical protein
MWLLDLFAYPLMLILGIAVGFWVALHRERVEHRYWAVSQVEKTARDQRTCGHDTLLVIEASNGCVQCAHRLGQIEGHVEAGAYYTADEAFAVSVSDSGEAGAT